MQDRLNHLSSDLQRVFAAQLQSVKIEYDEITVTIDTQTIFTGDATTLCCT